MKAIWMKVSCNELSLPEAIADSPQELSKICGVSVGSIYSSRNLYKHGHLKYPKYIAIKEEELNGERTKKGN